ncbi:redoxin family protein [Phenylobacterium sp.]|uniref:redoxin family protein n=1 Tax=Phenylobacterium sp. TaxID=1871053 RepID=UPI0025E7DC13|nr:redoxin family protein [Phenylobacterium sp.]
MSRWIAALPLVALLALGALFYFFALRHDPHYQPRTLVGREIPDLTLPDLAGGRPVRLREAVADGPIIVNFFASWCAPCEIEHPVLMGLKGEKVRLVGVAYKDAPPNTQALLTRLGDPYVQALVDRDGRAGVEFGVTGVPETYVIGRGGKVLAKHTGPLTEPEADVLAKLAR